MLNQIQRAKTTFFLVLIFLNAVDISTQIQNQVVAAGSVVSNEIIGRKIPNFVTQDSNGKQIGLQDFSHHRFLVVVFIGTQCPIGNAYVPYLNELHMKFKDRGVEVLGVNSNLADSPNEISQHAADYQIQFPMLVDSQQIVADLFSAERTPQAFVLDRRRNIRYSGRIDDKIGYDFKRKNASRLDLEIALQDLLAGKPVSKPTTTPLGCIITRKSSLLPKGEITYSTHIAKILETRCVNCHHPGTAAPFSLQTHEDSQNWSQMIKEVVQQQRMPPWSADPRHGKFSNDLRMPKSEIDTLVAWIDNGSPLGDKNKLPKSKPVVDGWMIEKPDVIFKMPKSFTVKASGTVDYKYFVTPTHFKKDVWVQASEARPGNRSVVHHIIVFVQPKGQPKGRGRAAIAGFAPGEEPMVFPAGTGFRVPAGAKLIWQIHYTPTGKVETDRCEVGMVFCKEKPDREIIQRDAMNRDFVIPARAENHQVVSSKRFSEDVELISLMPHMHFRGKDFTFIAEFPNGKKETLLSVPDYDFNWQHRYRFATPKPIPRGTTIRCIAHFDNSPENPANPAPDQPVRWGDQSWEEMMIGFLTYVKPEDRSQIRKLNAK
ncbi:thioredoxin family protein [Pirellulaceae bacterium]|nr:thioredoxin family protein [Pirellulaceae bacterium]MDB4793864.1 thioredoxin family protein [Pirellulaceae bacterium]